MQKPKLAILVLGTVFILWTGYYFFNSLSVPEHVHSRDDVPQQSGAAGQPSPEMIQALEARLLQEPDNFELLSQLGHIYLNVEHYEKAEKVFRKATKMQPDNADVMVDLGTALRGIGQYDQSLQTLIDATGKFPLYPNGWLQLAVLYRFNLKDNEKALENFQRFLLLDNQSEMIPRVKQEIERIKAEMNL